MSVEENLMLGAYSRPGGAREDDFAHCFALFPRLEERRSQRAGTLSGGEQQMLAIARGLMSRPRLLLMDEPSLGLAPQLVSRTFEVVERLRAAGTTILMVEQMARQALRVSDRAYVLEHGRIVGEGASADLLDDPRVLGAYLGSKHRAGRTVDSGIGRRTSVTSVLGPVTDRPVSTPIPCRRRRSVGYFTYPLRSHHHRYQDEGREESGDISDAQRQTLGSGLPSAGSQEIYSEGRYTRTSWPFIVSRVDSNS